MFSNKGELFHVEVKEMGNASHYATVEVLDFYILHNTGKVLKLRRTEKQCIAVKPAMDTRLVLICHERLTTFLVYFN
jgi:hypothetical protein